jgi:hypothetical protein
MLRLLKVFCVLLLFSCGIEDYPYLQPVDPDSVTRILNEQASLWLPSVSSSDGYFTNYIIYYRLYVSDALISGEITTDKLSSISSDLNSDFTSIEPYTKATNNLATNVGSLFSNRKFYALKLQDTNIDNVLDDSGGGLQIDFRITQENLYPRLVLQGVIHPLRRSNGDGLFNPLPENRQFLNTDELNSAANISSTINADIANKANITGARYVYAAMYIAASGFDPLSLAPIYSSPTYISIFMLPVPISPTSDEETTPTN